MKYIRTKDGHIYNVAISVYGLFAMSKESRVIKEIAKKDIVKQADTIEELLDEIVLIENGNEHNIVYLQEAYDRIDEYHEQGNYEPRLIGRIKAGLDKKAVAEWKENEQGLYDWVLL